MVFEVIYQAQKDSVDPPAKLYRIEYFESDTIPDESLIQKELTRKGIQFVEESISIAPREQDVQSMRQSGKKVTKI
jgi:hypothetical protein